MLLTTIQSMFAQGLLSDPASIIGWVIFIGFFLFSMLYGQRLQVMLWMNDIQNNLFKLKLMRDEARKIAVNNVKDIGKLEADPTGQIDRFLEYFAISPVELDPSGVIWRLEHLLDVRDTRFKDDVKLMAPKADDPQINNLENMLEATLALHIIYKVVRHFYLLGKKTSSLYIVMQLQMILPQIMKEAEAYAHAQKAFQLGQPIGDGAGALVAARLMQGHEKTKVEKDVVVAEVPIEGRNAFVLKAEGPGGNVGKPGEAIKQILDQNEGKISLAILVDAGLKLEGEKTGEIAEGVGVAIGGPEVDKYKVEESALKHQVPINAIIIKEDVGDAVSPMRKEIVDAIDGVIDRIKRLIQERTKTGDSIIIAGIGNTIGIGQ